MSRVAPALLLALAFGGLPEPAAVAPPDEEFDGPAADFGTGAFDPDDRDEFEQREEPVLPVFNGNSCVECHNHPATGGGNPGVTELRVGRSPGKDFRLVHTHAARADAAERVPAGFDLRELRVSPPLFGLGAVERVPDEWLLLVAAGQPAGMRGEAVRVDGGRVGRFGWKDQHATLLDFARDANTNEKGIPPQAPGFEDDVNAYARFMRALDPPPPDARVQADPRWAAGREVFRGLGCAVCHHERYDGFPAPAYSDFLLHDVGTGGGIVQTEPTGLKFRTAPLWGLRVKSRLMHDGMTFTRHEAVLRHAGEAAAVAARYRALPPERQRLLQIFLRGL